MRLAERVESHAPSIAPDRPSTGRASGAAYDRRAPRGRRSRPSSRSSIPGAHRARHRPLRLPARRRRPRRHRRGPRQHRPAVVHRRRLARRRLSRGQRACARRAAVERLQLADAARHREPGAADGAQDRLRARPRHRGRDPRGVRAGRRRGGRGARRSSASSGSTARCDRSRGTLCLTEALGERAVVLPGRQRRRGPAGGRPHDPRGHHAGRGGRVPPRRAAVARRPRVDGARRRCPRVPDLADVRGQPVGRFALEVAAAGGHHLLLLGPPGAGKTMLASRLPGPAPAAHRREPPSRPPGSTPPPVSGCRRAGWCASRRSGRRTTARRRSRWSAAAAPRCARARSARRATACCSSTSWPSSPSTCSTRCGSRWRRGWCGWRGPPAPSRSPPGSCWWPP